MHEPQSALRFALHYPIWYRTKTSRDRDWDTVPPLHILILFYSLFAARMKALMRCRLSFGTDCCVMLYLNHAGEAPSNNSIIFTNLLFYYTMRGSIEVISKGVMMGAAIIFTAIRREHTFYNCFILGLFSLTTMAHVAMSLSATTLLLYAFTAISIPSLLAVLVISQPQFVSVFDYAPVLVAFMLWVIDDCSRLHPGVSCPLRRWATDMDGGGQYGGHPRAWSVRVHGSTTPPPPPPSFGGSMIISPDDDSESFLSFNNNNRDDDKTVIGPRENLLRFIGSRGQSCAPSSRLSDISLSSSVPESLPSSWGTLTRIWFSTDVPVQGRYSRDPSHAGCRRVRSALDT